VRVFLIGWQLHKSARGILFPPICALFTLYSDTPRFLVLAHSRILRHLLFISYARLKITFHSLDARLKTISTQDWKIFRWIHSTHYSFRFWSQNPKQDASTHQ
jgi:hypothetical protein